MATDTAPREIADALPQHLTALQKANRVRLARAALKGEIAEGRRAVSDLFDEPDAQTMPLVEALRAQHRWGRTRVLKLLREVRIGETVTFGRLTDRQRRALIDAGV